MLPGRDLTTAAQEMVAGSSHGTSAFDGGNMRLGNQLKRALGEAHADEDEKDKKTKESDQETDEAEDDVERSTDGGSLPTKPGKKAKWFDRDGSITKAVRKEPLAAVLGCAFRVSY